MRFGLSEETITKIRQVFADHPSVDKAVLFGSRAKGNFRPGSDIDLTLFGAALTPRELDSIELALDDLMLPYCIDLSNFDELEHRGLREHIERVGILFYQRQDSDIRHAGQAT